MKRLKRSVPRDRLSELPDALILHILSLLPTRDAVRTAFLSKRWQGLWTTVPSLVFDSDYTSPDSLLRFVNRTILHWKGMKLQKFSLNFLNFPLQSFPFSGDVDTWLHFAIEKGVEELSVDLTKDLYSPPQSLYSCSTIRQASLALYTLKIRGEVQWSLLTSLRIEVRRLSDVAVEKIVSAAPRLETLSLSYVKFTGHLNVRSESLKRLTIERNMSRRGSEKVNTQARIFTPNIEVLEISYGTGNSNVRKELKQMLEKNVCKELKRMLEDFFLNISCLERVTLAGRFIKVLREIKEENKHIVAPLSNVKFLRVHDTLVDDVVDILEIFPALTRLVVSQESGTHKDPNFFKIVCPRTATCISEFDAEESLQAKSDILSPYLRTIEITWAVDDNTLFPLIEILWKNVRKLEKMVLRVTGTGSAESVVPLLLASQRLLSVQRAFPGADVILRQDE